MAISTFTMLYNHYHYFWKLLSSWIEILHSLNDDSAFPLPQPLVASNFVLFPQLGLKSFKDFDYYYFLIWPHRVLVVVCGMLAASPPGKPPEGQGFFYMPKVTLGLLWQSIILWVDETAGVYFSQFGESEKPKMKVNLPSRLTSWLRALLALLTAAFSASPHVAERGRFGLPVTHRDTNSTLGPYLRDLI